MFPYLKVFYELSCKVPAGNVSAVEVYDSSAVVSSSALTLSDQSINHSVDSINQSRSQTGDRRLFWPLSSHASCSGVAADGSGVACGRKCFGCSNEAEFPSTLILYSCWCQAPTPRLLEALVARSAELSTVSHSSEHDRVGERDS